MVHYRMNGFHDSLHFVVHAPQGNGCDNPQHVSHSSNGQVALVIPLFICSYEQITIAFFIHLTKYDMNGILTLYTHSMNLSYVIAWVNKKISRHKFRNPEITLLNTDYFNLFLSIMLAKGCVM